MTRCSRSSTTSSTSRRSRRVGWSSTRHPFVLRDTVEASLDIIAPGGRDARAWSSCTRSTTTLPVALVGDAGRLRQMLLNLLSNAVKFTERGEVRRHRRWPAPRAAAGSRRGERWEIRIDVRDTGIGIPADGDGQAVPVVQPGRRLHRAALRRHRPRSGDQPPARGADGTVRSTRTSTGVAGEGSIFRLAVRLTAAAAPTPWRPTRPMRIDADLAGRTVLVVDDNATNRRILVAQTARWGMVPRETGSSDGGAPLARGGRALRRRARRPRSCRSSTASSSRRGSPRWRGGDGAAMPVVILSSIGAA